MSRALRWLVLSPQLYRRFLCACISVSGSPAAPIVPSKVTFDERLQTLSASLLGLGCTANTTTGVITCTSPETIQLLLSTTSAHSFNFLVNGALSSGVYQVQMGVQVSETATSTGSVPAGASVQVGVGAGSLIEEILQSQTPFTTVTPCNPSGTTTGTAVNGCGPSG